MFILSPTIFCQTSTIIFIFVAWNSIENFWTTFFCLYKNISFRYWTCTYKSLVIFSTSAFEQLGALWVCDFSLCYIYPPLGTTSFQQWGYEERVGTSTLYKSNYLLWPWVFICPFIQQKNVEHLLIQPVPWDFLVNITFSDHWYLIFGNSLFGLTSVTSEPNLNLWRLFSWSQFSLKTLVLMFTWKNDFHLNIIQRKKFNDLHYLIYWS